MNEEEKQKLQQHVLALENLAKQYMDSAAISRYGNIKAVDKEKALQIIAFIAELVNQKQLKEKITDAQLKQLLMHLQQPKKEFKIKRI